MFVRNGCAHSNPLKTKMVRFLFSEVIAVKNSWKHWCYLQDNFIFRVYTRALDKAYSSSHLVIHAPTRRLITPRTATIIVFVMARWGSPMIIVSLSPLLT